MQNSMLKFVAFLICTISWVILLYYSYTVYITTCEYMQSKFKESNKDIGILSGDTVGGSENVKQVCYYAIARDSLADKTRNFSITEVDPFLCTHLIIASASIANNTIKLDDQSHLKIFEDAIALRKKNPKLKVMLCLAGDEAFSLMVKNSWAVSIFAYNAQQFLLTHGLDGLDLDWEFPAWPNMFNNTQEVDQFSYLLLQLNNALKLASHPPFLLSVAVGAPKAIIDRCYDAKAIAMNVDFVSLMGYDYHMYFHYLPFTGFNAPLHKRRKEMGYFGTLNIEWSSRYWVSKGVPKDKLVIGIPVYGRSWKLLSFAWHGLDAPAVGEGFLDGEVTYPEALTFLKEGGTSIFDTQAMVPYAFRGLDWISYEDRRSVRAKAEWIKEEDFAGVMIWDLNCDDTSGQLSGKKFDLHYLVKSIVRKNGR